MRTLLTGELATALDPNSDYYVKCEVQNGSATWIDVGGLLGSRWVVNLTCGEDINTPVAQATVTLMQRQGANSLAPLMSASILNVDDDGAYSPQLEIGRAARCWVATMPKGVPLDPAKYREVLTGRVHDVSGADQADDVGPITVTLDDLGGWLAAKQIKVDGVQYGGEVAIGLFVVGRTYTIVTPASSDHFFTDIGAASNTAGVVFTATGPGTGGGGTALPNLETVVQDILDATIPVSEPAVTLDKESTSDFAVTSFALGRGALLNALTGLVLDSVGEDLRYRYGADHVSRLTWFNPDRDRVTVDATIGPDQYVMTTVDRSIDEIRNSGEMPFTDETAGTAGTVTSQNATSIAQFREQYFTLDASPMLTTQAQTQAALDAVVSDLSFAPIDATAVCPFLWFVQLYDRYTFQANNRQWDQDQTLAVSAYQHSIQNGQGSTTLTLAGRVIGAYAEWLRRIGATSLVAEAANIGRVSATESADGTTRDFTVTLNANVETVHVHYRTVSIDETGDAFDFSGDEDVSASPTLMILRRVAGSEQVTFSIPHPVRGFKVAARLIPYTAPTPQIVEGASWPVEIEAAPPALNAKLLPTRATVTADLAVVVAFGVSDGPVQVDVFEGDIDGTPLLTVTLAAPATLDKTGYPVLGARALPDGKDSLFWRVRLTDVSGDQYWFGPATANRDPLPTGSPTVQNYRPAPSIVCPFDPDTDQIRYTSSGGKIKTFSSAVLAIAGSPVTYTVGDAFDDASTEAALVVDETRSGAKIEYQGGGQWITMWAADLHGTPSNPPTGKVRIVTDADGSSEDGYVVVDSPVGELLRVFYRDGDGSGAPVYGLVAGAADPTPLYVAALTEVGPANYFKNIDGTGGIVQVLSAVPLARDQIQRSAIQVEGKDSGVTSSWIPMTFSLLAQPWCESIAPLFDQSTRTLSVTLVAGAHTASAFFELADNDIFTSPTTASGDVADGATLVKSIVLSAAELGKPWYVRVTPFNAITLGGLSGVPQQASIAVPAFYQIDATPSETSGDGTVTLVVADPGSVLDQTATDGTITSAISWHVTRAGVYVAPEASTTVPAAGATTGTWTKTVTLDPLHNITLVAMAHFVDGSTRVIGTWTFDSNKISDLASASVAYNGDTATVKLNWDTDTKVGANCARYSRDAGATWTATVTVGADLTSSIDITRTGANQVVLVQALSAIDSTYGDPASVIVSGFVADGPTLSVVETPGDTAYSIAWAGTGTVTLAIDGGTPTTPPASPIIVALDGAAHSYAFEATLAGQAVPRGVSIPALQPPQVTGVTCGAAFFPNDGGGSFTVSWTPFNLSSSCTFDITFTVTAGNYMTGGPWNGKSQASVSSGDTISYPFASQPDLNLTVIAKDINGVEVGRGSFVGTVSL